MYKILIILCLLLLGCDSRVITNSNVVVNEIRSFTDSTCIYEVVNKNNVGGIYSDDAMYGYLEDKCNKFQIGDTIMLVAVKVDSLKGN
jgi:hypothetical protein